MTMKHTPRHRCNLSHLVTGLSIAVAAGTFAVGGPTSGAAIARPLASVSDASAFTIDVAKVGDKVTIKLKDGRTVIGEVVSIDDGEIKLRQKVGAMTATIEYKRSEIESTTLTEPALANKPIDTKSTDTKSTDTKSTDTKAPEAKAPDTKDAAKPTDGNTPKVYIVPFNGEFGRDISATPVKDVMKDAKKAQPDYLVIHIDCAFKFEGQEGRDEVDTDGMRLSWGQGFETAAELATLLTDSIRDDKTWVKQPTVIMWVRKAMGPVAFLPWVSPNIYFASDGRLGGIGYMERMFGGRGDETVRQKQYSLRLGRAEGLAAKGKHETVLIRAMAYMKEVLSVSFVGGEPQYFENTTGDELLTDTGLGNERDSLEEMVRLEGNDCLNLNAQLAMKLKVAKGIADTKDQLMYELGIERNFIEVKGKASDIFKNWSIAVNKADRDIPRMYREAQEMAITGTTPAERNSARGKRMGQLNKVIELANRYQEALPRATGGGQLQINSRIEIEQLRQAITLDR